MITPIPNQMISTVIPEVPSVNVDVRDGEVEKNPLRVTTGKQKPEQMESCVRLGRDIMNSWDGVMLRCWDGWMMDVYSFKTNSKSP